MINASANRQISFAILIYTCFSKFASSQLPRGFTFLWVLVLVLSTASSSVRAQSSGFDFAKDNAAFALVQRQAVDAILNDYSPTASDASLVLRAFVMLSNGFYDAVAPYHPTAVGVYTRLERRPAIETEDNTKMNIAILYASHKVLSNLFPDRIGQWDKFLRDLGLDPTDISEDLTTAVGIGNAAGRGVVEGRAHDGMNAIGDEGGRSFNLLPFFDYTGYKPVNTAFDLVDPSRWQPQLQRVNAGNYRIQQFVTPQFRFVEPYSYTDPTVFGVPAPINSDYGNLELYTAQAKHVLDVSLALDDTQRMMAEFFDNKIFSLGGSGFVSARNANLDLFDSVVSNFFSNIAVFDAGVFVWQEKNEYDAVRPFSAIHLIFEGQSIRSDGFPGEEWAAYLPEADHPEYPSASACFCAAHSQFKRRFFGSDDLKWSIPVSAGASRILPGVTPTSDLVLNFETWTDFEQACGQSRVWAGVHFQSAVDESLKICPMFGDLAHDYMQDLITGVAEPRGPSSSTMR